MSTNILQTIMTANCKVTPTTSTPAKVKIFQVTRDHKTACVQHASINYCDNNYAMSCMQIKVYDSYIICGTELTTQ